MSRRKARISAEQPRPITEDWATAEYGLSAEELDQVASNLIKSGEALLKSGKTVSLVKFHKRRKVI